MGAPKIRLNKKAVYRKQRQIHEMFRAGTKRHVTVVQDENTKQVLAVMVDRNAYDRLNKDRMDLSHAELIDFELVV